MNELLAFEKPHPVIVRIDEMSPLYDLAPRDILSKQFEIIVTLDGTTQETGNQIQVRIKNQSTYARMPCENYNTRREPVLAAALSPIACPSRCVRPPSLHLAGALGPESVLT